MRITRTGRILIGIAILFTIASAWVVSSWPPPRNHRLVDGTVLRVERVSYGARDQSYAPPVSMFDDWKGKLAAVLPKKWAAKITVKKFTSNGSWWMNATIHSNVNSLNIWITRRDKTNGFVPVDSSQAELIDDDGCVYLPTQSGGMTYVPPGSFSSGWPTRSIMTWFTFEAYPRHQVKMLLRLYSSSTNLSRGVLGEFVILNPAPRAASASGWTLEPLPIEKTWGDTSFTLKSIGYKTNWIGDNTNSPPWRFSISPVDIVPRFAVLERGQKTTQWRPAEIVPDPAEGQNLVEQPSDWEAVDMDLSDSSGNIASKQYGRPISLFLSPHEPGWKLAVKFFGSEQAEDASNTVWVIHDVKVPGPAEHTALPFETNMDGVFVKTVALAGAGKATYVGDELKEIFPHESPMSNAPPGRGAEQWQVADSTMPHISFRFEGLKDDQRLTIRAVAPGGKEYYAQGPSYPYNRPVTPPADRISYLQETPGYYHLSWFPMDLPADVKTVDLYFCVHRARLVTFTFKPPPQ